MTEKDVDRFWSSIYWLVVLAEQGSFTAAAQYLSVSKATMSQRMAALEHAARVPLIQRTTRSVRLTEAGRQLVKSTHAAYSDIAQSFAKIQDFSNEPTGLLRVTAPVALSRQHLIACLPEFSRKYPGVQIELDMSDLMVSLVADGFDLAVRHVEVPPDVYVAKMLFRTRTLLVASPQYLAINGTPNHPSNLGEHRLLFYSRHPNKTNWIFERVNTKTPADCVTVPVRPYFVVNNSEALRDMACSGAGVALVPDFSAQVSIQKGDLVELLSQWRPIGVFGSTVFLLRPYTSQATPRALGAFISFLLSKFSQSYYSGDAEVTSKAQTAG